MKKIVFAGGCFWGVEAYFNNRKGILSTKVGYANGNTLNPTYEEVCMKNTGFAEACFINYDEKVTSLSELLTSYWKIVDPTVLNRQGHDVGSQYRTGIYYFDEEDFPTILASIKMEQQKYKTSIVTEVELLQNFYPAEDYHQKYLQKNPKGYCHIPMELLEE